MSGPERPRMGLTRPLLLALAGLGLALFLLPLVGLVARIPAGSLLERLGSPAVSTALRLSLVVATAATGLSLLFGFPLAWTLARVEFPGKRLVRGLVTLPMVLPPVVAGVALLAAFGRRGLFGPALAAIGIELPYSTLGAIVAATFVSAPFLVLTLEAAITSHDRSLEDAAATLGASDWRILWTVLLPGIAPALAAAVALAFARALGEFGATITFAGNSPGRTQTMPLAVARAIQSDYDGAMAISFILLVIALATLLALRGHVAGGRR